MKSVEEVTACVVDYGTFICLAEGLAKSFKKVYYHSPIYREYLDVNDCVKGVVPGIERVDAIFDPDLLPKVDLFIFPDINWGPEQRYLRSIGKAVWGAGDVGNLELFRTKFLDYIEELGLPMSRSFRIRGVTALDDHLKRTKGEKWVKINRFRAVAETWKHQDYAHSVAKLDELAVRLGGFKERAMFVVQDPIDSEEGAEVVEIGYDGWSVDGQFPTSSFQGYEAKNELYLGSVLKADDLPDQVKLINEAMTPLLGQSQYRCFLATELRVKDGEPYFIDPTFRMAGQTQEQLIRTCSNLAQVIWEGANGILAAPEFVAPFAAEATLHYKNHVKGQWYQLNVPEAMADRVKLYHYYRDGEMCHFPPRDCDEPGVVIGMGGTPAEAIDDLKETLDELSGEPVECDLSGFIDLAKQIEVAEGEGMKFSDEPIPEPVEILK